MIFKNVLLRNKLNAWSNIMASKMPQMRRRSKPKAMAAAVVAAAGGRSVAGAVQKQS